MNSSLIPAYSVVNSYVPEWVIDLLWFKDGPLENRLPKALYDGYRDEPSEISLELPIKEVAYIDGVPKLDYYPSYCEFTPEQRWIYLNWLKNPLNPIDVGYVYVFYYGLERHLLPGGKYEAAFDAIQALRKAHPKIDSYAFGALMISTVLRGDFARYLRLIENYVPEYWPPYLAGKRHFGVGLTVEEIIRLAGKVGYKNRRYINNEPTLFRITLDRILAEKYGTSSFPIETLDLVDCPEIPSFYLANYSINPEIRTFDIVNILEHPEFREAILALLTQTHESVKSTLKENRQAQKS